jgi:pimeloyl-ACP methyl ester carboxylesterase
MSIFNYQGQDIFYEIDGELNDQKEVIVILNGIMMSSKSWQPFVENFTQQHVLLRYDMFDQGQSARRSEPYTQEIQVALLKSLLEYLKIEKANIVGISYGASIALQFAVKHPSMIRRMIIANVVAKTSPWLKDIGDGWNEVAKTGNGLAYYYITIPYIYSPQFYTKHNDWMIKRKDVLVPLFSTREFLDRMIRLTKSAETHDVTKSMDKIKVPTLIISSEEDYLTPPFEQTYLHHHMPNSELVLIPSCGHASMYEVPSVFTSLVLGFIGQRNLTYQI